MIRLVHITKNEKTITCGAFLEDCKEEIPLVFDIATGKILPVQLPKDYEWCSTHIGHARWFLKGMLEKGEFTESKLIMWC